MKLIRQFQTFLDDQVNLNKTRLDSLENSVEAIQRAVCNSDWGVTVLDFIPQGSWAHGTIIKPLPDKEFDADLLIIVESKDGWEAKDYVNKLKKSLEKNGTYSGKLSIYSHCVTVNYAGDKKIDIAPCIKGRENENTYEVCNRTSNEFEISSPIDYTNWINEKNSITTKNHLKKTTRLLKYLRDIKGNFTCPSFLLTTLIGYCIFEDDSAFFCDVPTSLNTIISRLDDLLQDNTDIPIILNPVLESEVQSSCWDNDKYLNFRKKINLYREWINDAFNEEDRNESIAKWRKVFGDKFAEQEANEEGKITESLAKKAGASYVFSTSNLDAVYLVKFGLNSYIEEITKKILKLPYLERPRWKKDLILWRKVFVKATLNPKNAIEKSVISLEILQKGCSITFFAVDTSGFSFDSNIIDIKWRIANTDTEAFNANSLRGCFYSGNRGLNRYEELQYRGVHIVEAFVIWKKTERIIGKSDPFYVVIE